MTCDRIDELVEAIESVAKIAKEPPASVQVELVVLMNGSSDDHYKRFINSAACMLKDFHSSVVLRSPVNKGVAGGRNEMFRAASGEILFFIDDDALLITDVRTFWYGVLNEYRYGKTGALAFRSVNVDGSDRAKEIPTIMVDRKTDVASFVGVGHVIFRKAIGCSFLYPDNLFYGMEEVYLSCRIINNGFGIRYDPDLVVCHRKSDLTRLGNAEYFIHLASNKVYISYLCFGFFRRISFFFLWSGWLMKKTGLSVESYFVFLKRLRALQRTTNSKIFRISTKPCFWRYLKRVKESYWK